MTVEMPMETLTKVCRSKYARLSCLSSRIKLALKSAADLTDLAINVSSFVFSVGCQHHDTFWSNFKL